MAAATRPPADLAPGPGAPRLATWLWLTAIAVLPITSAGFLPLGAMVRPVMPLLGVLALGVVLLADRRLAPRLAGDGGVRWLAALGAVLVASGLWHVGSDAIPPLKGQSASGALLKSLLTLLLGFGTYLAARSFLADARIRLASLRLLLGGVVAGCALGGVQILAHAGVGWAEAVAGSVAGHVTGNDPGMVAVWCEGRAWGWAYEPSWWASQLSLLALPIGLATFAFGADAPSRRLGLLLAGLASLGLAMAASRGGSTGSLIGLAAVLALALWWWVRSRERALLVLAVVSLVLAVIVATGTLRTPTSRKSVQQVAQITTELTTDDEPGDQRLVGRRVSAMGRIGSWTGAWRTFLEAPVCGAGLGLSPWGVTRNFPEELRHSKNREIARWMSSDPGPPANPKNLFLRILAEGGLLAGLALAGFLGWHLLAAWRTPAANRRKVVLLLAVSVPAIAVDMMSLDSFALPTIWLLLAWLVCEARTDQVPPGADGQSAAQAAMNPPFSGLSGA